jgi:hypothetical protein
VGHVGVARALAIFGDSKGALVKPLRLRVPALVFIHEGQVVEGRGHIGVARAQRLLPDCQRALV